MSPFFYKRGSRGKGAAAPFPCTPNPRRTCLRFAWCPRFALPLG